MNLLQIYKACKIAKLKAFLHHFILVNNKSGAQMKYFGKNPDYYPVNAKRNKFV